MRKLSKLLAIAGLSLGLPLYGQEVVEWQETLGSSNAESCKASCLTSDGGIFLGGQKTISGNTDYYVIKLDADGNTDWQASYGGSSSDLLTDVRQTSDGGYILAGYSNSGISGDKTEASRGSYDYWIVKLDAAGNVVWDKTLGGSSSESVKVVIRELPGGNFVIGGTSESNSSGEKSANSYGLFDYWILEYEAPSLLFPSGQVIWDRTIGSSGQDIFADLVYSSSTNSFYITGHSAGNISGDKTENSIGSYDYWTVNLDNTGATVIWDQTTGGTGNESASVLLEDSNGDVVIAGSSSSGLSGDKGCAGNGSSDFWLIKLDASGVVYPGLNACFGGSGSEYPFSIQEMGTTGYLIGGISGSGLTGSRSQVSRGGNDYWSVETDYTLSYLDDRAFGGSSNEDNGMIWLTASGEYFLAGGSLSNSSGDKSDNAIGSSDFWCIKLAPYSNNLFSYTDICAALQSVALSAGNTNGAYTYSWTSVPAGFVSSAKNPSVSPSVNTIYYLTVTNNSSETVASHSISVSVKNCCDYDPSSFTKFYQTFRNDLITNNPNRFNAGLTSDEALLIPSGVDSDPGPTLNLDGFLTKIESNGVQSFSYSYDGTAPGNTIIYSSQQIHTGDYVVVGSTTTMGSGTAVAFIQSVNPIHGTVNWTTYLNQNVHNLKSIHFDQSNNSKRELVVAGSADITGGGSTSYLVLFIIDPVTGAVNTSYGAHTFTNGLSRILVTDVTATADEGFVVSGHGINSSDLYWAGFLARFDKNYALSWMQEYEYPCPAGSGCHLASIDANKRALNKFNEVIEDPNTGELVVVGQVSNENPFSNLGMTYKYGLICKIDGSSGMINSKQLFDYGASTFTEFLGITYSPANSEYLVTGGVYYPLTNPKEQALLTRIDNTLNMVFSHEFSPSPFMPVNRGHSVHELGNGDIIVSGICQSTINSDLFTLRTDLNGALNNCEITSSVTETDVTIVENPIDLNSPVGATENSTLFSETLNCALATMQCLSSSFVIPGQSPTEPHAPQHRHTLAKESKTPEVPVLYPNPSSGLFNLSSPIEITKALVLDYTGREVSRFQQTQALEQLDLSGLSQGLYLVSLYSGNELIGVVRVQIQH